MMEDYLRQEFNLEIFFFEGFEIVTLLKYQLI